MEEYLASMDMYREYQESLDKVYTSLKKWMPEQEYITFIQQNKRYAYLRS